MSVEKTCKQNKPLGQGGQIIVEYVLLMIIAVSIAALITSLMVSRNQSNTGFLILKWNEIIRTIGADDIEDPTPSANP